MYSDADSRSPSPAPTNSASTTSDSRSPATSAEVDAGYAAYELRRILAKIDQARDEQALFWISNTAFGPNCFCSRLGEALGSNAAYLPFLKLFVQAELEDRLSGRVEWPPVSNRSLGFGGPELWEVGHHLRRDRLSLQRDQAPLKKAAEARDELLSELKILFTPGIAAFAPIHEKLDPQTQLHWDRYLAAVTNTKTQSDAGWSFGMVFLQVLSALKMFAETHMYTAVSDAFPALSGHVSASDRS